MHITVALGQMPLEPDVQGNLAHILKAVKACQPGDLLLLPEGALSGYQNHTGWVHTLDAQAIAAGIVSIRDAVEAQQIYALCGTYAQVGSDWVNRALGFGPEGLMFTYDKVNLSLAERTEVVAGHQLPVWHIAHPHGPLCIGVQICREIRFPAQWRALATQGAQLLCFLTSSSGSLLDTPVWRSHLISRAAENQRFVVAVNHALTNSQCPSLIADPHGQVYWEDASSRARFHRQRLDLSQVSDWYLSQQRHDLL